MKLNGIKNIIFDLGGVLLNLDFWLSKQAFKDLGVVNYDEHFSQAKQTGVFDLFETGKTSESEFCNQLREVTGIDSSNGEIVFAWNAMLLDFPKERKELLIKLKEHYSIALLSNTNVTHIEAFTEIIKKDINQDSLEPLFDSVIYSNEVGLRKPNKEIFELILEQNNYNPEETLFLDDTIRHLEGAKQCGIQTIHINGITVEELFADFLT